MRQVYPNAGRSVVTVGLGSFSLIAWATMQRYVFTGPSINFELLNVAHNETLRHAPVIHGIDVTGTLPMSKVEEYPADAAVTKLIKGE